jgi:hypothetical protein
MVNKLLALLLFATAVVFTLSAPACAQDKKEGRWEGTVIRFNADKTAIDVRKVGGTLEKTIHFDSSTKWTSQFHGSKEVNNIDASEVKEGDRVICIGTFDDKGDFHATSISKRLSHSPGK